MLYFMEDWKIKLVVGLAGVCGLGGWSLGRQLDLNWGSEFMAVTLAACAALIGTAIGWWLVRPATE